jgi:hypothetical protein
MTSIQIGNWIESIGMRSTAVTANTGGVCDDDIVLFDVFIAKTIFAPPLLTVTQIMTSNRLESFKH